MRSLRLGFGVFLLCAAASADLPPPDGQRFVGFSFSVENVEAFPDYVLLAFPCGSSSGVPMADYALLSEGKAVDVGRRGGSCKLYAMKKAAFDEWKVGYQPSRSFDDPKLTELFSSKRVTECDLSPTITHTLSTSDSRTSVKQVLRAEKIDATTCHITNVAEPNPKPSDPAPKPVDSPASTAPAPAPKSASQEPPADAPPAPAKARGCAGCSADGSGSAGSATWGALLLLVALFRKQRR